MKKSVKSVIFFLLAMSFALLLSIPMRASQPSVSAKAAIVYCLENGTVLYSKNSDTCLPMASTTKIMSTLLTLESGNLDEKFTVDSEAIAVEGSSMGLLSGDIVSKRILCYGMMLPSGNDAANAAAVAVSGSVNEFVSLMNNRATELGMLNTHFVTPSGLDDYTDEHYSTAYDMAILTAYALRNSDFAKICSTTAISFDLGNERSVWLSNSNRLLTALDNCIGVKTGFTDKAGRCLVSAVRYNGITLICVTLNASDDWNDHIRLYADCFKQVENFSIDGVAVRVPLVGALQNVALLKSDSVSCVIMTEDISEITKKIYVPRFIYAPADKTNPLGRVDYYLGEKLIASADLYLDDVMIN